MKNFTVDLGLHEDASIAGVRGADNMDKLPYSKQQIEMNSYVTHDLIYNYTPNFNGGYVVLLDPGLWPELLKYDRKLRDEYGERLNQYTQLAKNFILHTMKLIYQIDPGSVNVSSDNYNLRHLNQQLFSYESKISSVSVTYLEEKNLVEHTHYLWIEFMKDLKKGLVDLPDEYIAKDTDLFYQVPYYGQIWAYAYNPVDLRPREIVKYIGIYPSNDALGDSFGQRGQNNHYMKNIPYNVVDFDRSVYPITEHCTSEGHFDNFYKESILFKDFIDTCTSLGILNERS